MPAKEGEEHKKGKKVKPGLKLVPCNFNAPGSRPVTVECVKLPKHSTGRFGAHMPNPCVVLMIKGPNGYDHGEFIAMSEGRPDDKDPTFRTTITLPGPQGDRKDCQYRFVIYDVGQKYTKRTQATSRFVKKHILGYADFSYREINMTWDNAMKINSSIPQAATQPRLLVHDDKATAAKLKKKKSRIKLTIRAANTRKSRNPLGPGALQHGEHYYVDPTESTMGGLFNNAIGGHAWLTNLRLCFFQNEAKNITALKRKNSRLATKRQNNRPPSRKKKETKKDDPKKLKMMLNASILRQGKDKKESTDNKQQTQESKNSVELIPANTMFEYPRRYCTFINQCVLLEIPVYNIHEVSIDEKMPGKITVVTKDAGTYSFSQDPSEPNALYAYLSTLPYPDENFHLFAFTAGLNKDQKQVQNAVFEDESGNEAKFIDGWSLYNPREDFKRLGLHRDGFGVYEYNSKYEVCATYPKLICLPKADMGLEFKEFKSLFDHRSKSRGPAIVYKNPRTGVVMARCSQPCAGMSFKKNAEDVKFMDVLFNHTKKLGASAPVFIADARPKLSAAANRAQGKGYEDPRHYLSANLEFLDIENIHHVRNAFNEMRAVCSPSAGGANFFSQIDQTHYPLYTLSVLKGGVKCAELMEKHHANVVVHCSDGWDRTSQLCALAELIQDSYYRTLKGFAILIEKEWVSFGHKFGERFGHGGSDTGNTQRAPVFFQFMDCVYQIMNQFPTEFEFNEDYLLAIQKHVNSCRFGTFLFDNEQERDHSKVRQETESLWTYLLHPDRVFLYTNALYFPTLVVLDVSVDPRKFVLWQKFWMNWDISPAACVVRDLEDVVNRRIEPIDETPLADLRKQAIAVADSTLSRRSYMHVLSGKEKKTQTTGRRLNSTLTVGNHSRMYRKGSYRVSSTNQEEATSSSTSLSLQ